MSVLGIHDAHDAGAGIVSSGRVVGAVNEERFTKRKNDVGFPANSIHWLLKNISEDIDTVAVPWIGQRAFREGIPIARDKEEETLEEGEQETNETRNEVHQLHVQGHTGPEAKGPVAVCR